MGMPALQKGRVWQMAGAAAPAQQGPRVPEAGAACGGWDRSRTCPTDGGHGNARPTERAGLADGRRWRSWPTGNGQGNLLLEEEAASPPGTGRRPVLPGPGSRLRRLGQAAGLSYPWRAWARPPYNSRTGRRMAGGGAPGQRATDRVACFWRRRRLRRLGQVADLSYRGLEAACGGWDRSRTCPTHGGRGHARPTTAERVGRWQEVALLPNGQRTG